MRNNSTHLDSFPRKVCCATVLGGDPAIKLLISWLILTRRPSSTTNLLTDEPTELLDMKIDSEDDW